MQISRPVQPTAPATVPTPVAAKSPAPAAQVSVQKDKPAVADTDQLKLELPPAGAVSVDVLSLNTFGLPKPLGKAIAERHLRIGQSLGAFEIVGLQETFSGESKNLAKGASLAGLSYHAHVPAAQRLLNSGLTTFSSYEILERDFQPFHYSSHADSLAQKGVSFARVNVPGVGPVDVYNTHFQAASDKADSTLDKLLLKATSLLVPGFDMPRDQIREHDAEVLLKLMAEKDQGYPVLVLGDFNTQDHQPVYKMLTDAGLKDSYREANPTDPGYTSDGKTNPYKDNPDKRKRVDYVFYRPGTEVDLRVKSSQLAFDTAVDGMFVSDHYGVQTRFEFVPKPERADTP